MPVTPTYPGVYIEEVPSGVRTITGVATSITAFVGYTARGPVNKAVRIHNWGDYEREFGGLHPDSLVGYAVQQFFLNGGSDAYVVRVTAGGDASGLELEDAGATAVLEVLASSVGEWGNLIRLDVDYATRNADSLFNLTATRLARVGTDLKPAESEKHRNLSMNSRSSSYAPSVVNNASNLIRVSRAAGLTFDAGFALSREVTFPVDITGCNIISGVLDGTRQFVLELEEGVCNDMDALVAAVQSAIEGSGLPEDSMDAEETGGGGGPGTGYLRLFSLREDDWSSVTISRVPSKDLAVKLGLGLTNGGREFDGAAGRRPVVCSAVALAGGADGGVPGATELKGDFDNKTGIYALRDVDVFNLLAIPDTTALTEEQAKAVISAAVAFCEDERAFFLVDPDPALGRTTIEAWVSAVGRHKNAAVYFPQVKVADPLGEYRLVNRPPSGTIAGLMARTDAARGVWKAPAGTDAGLRGVGDLSVVLTDLECGDLNQLGINCLRSFPVYGKVCWGARTLEGADTMASEWKYIPVRRLALYLEESLYRGTQWVVFEPNDEPLWAQIRLNIGAFMHNLFRQGAFQGTNPKDAYFVKCDKETTTQNDINLGIVNILVGFAPLKPAEFVIIKIQQMAGQIQV
jgi:hypothetical protein